MTDKIIITIPRKKKTPKRSGGSPKRGPIINKRKPEYLSRRRTASGITFYDLGQKWNANTSTWDDNVPSFDYSNYITYEPPGSPWNRPEFAPAPDLPDHNAFANSFLNVPVNEWHTTFRKLEYEDAHKYGLGVMDIAEEEISPVAKNGTVGLAGALVSDSKLTETGTFEWGGPQRSAIVSSGAFVEIAFGDTEVRVTSEPAYDGNIVSNFTLPTKCEVYLMPRPVLIRSHGPANEASELFQYAFGVQALRRSIWLAETVEIEGIETPILAVPVGTSGAALLSTLLQDTGINMEYLEQSPVELGPGMFDIRFDPIPFAEFYPLSGESYTYTAYSRPTPDNNDPTVEIPPVAKIPDGGLIGAIKAGSSVYYLWSNQNSSFWTVEKVVTASL